MVTRSYDYFQERPVLLEQNSVLVEKVHRADSRAALIRWICVGLLAGIGLLVAGAWIGAHWS